MDVIRHYDLLIDEGNDPFRDPPQLSSYMDKWDGEKFIRLLNLTGNERVLEIGIGTGRLAVRVLPKCREFIGIDISPKTIERAKENLHEFKNASLICGDFLEYSPKLAFDVLYSSLALMHFEDKYAFIRKVYSLLNYGGVLVLSIDKNKDEFLDMGTRRLRIYPDDPNTIEGIIKEIGMKLITIEETEFAYIFKAQK